MPYVETMQEKSCLACGNGFICGKSHDPDTLCWCFEYPAVMPMESVTGCYCPDCLKPLIQARIQAFCAAVTPETALTCGAQQYARKGALIEDIDYTLDPNGNFVLSAWYLLKRGHCCKNGCRNCPYGYRQGA